ncbi:cytosolic endo-beta-N-acetylglucosaminidase 1-like [Vigna unguiculata]|uniref:mannosyl-glycoprotein endo-beta-N-acetylglucosaminidase n=1 Tax=Vigna unguiculata TaxID=3917 RepID=A0A4D6MKS2_VIGUN|nr:cytosolic endo-beta-N-acetylglucosaminidase 1-like [Vigna unguiculata]QCE01374.1 mannosyl-glycoprotein endo-beta-N-acetylglucosaminidase [Vigna unguiculata]
MSKSKFDPKQPSLPISYPIHELQDLESGSYYQSFHYPFNKASVPIETGYSAPLPDRRRILVCHDMAGGYLDDKWVQGGTNADAYAIWHWHLIDVFVYFSHNLVTLPPPSWTNAAHRHGVKVLGSFITESEKGSAICEKLLSTKESARMYAERLAELAFKLGFDGWLLNMEVELQPKQIPNLKEFISHLSLTTHSSVPGSLVIWYDSVTIEGDLYYQNELNELNRPFFDLCDGLFANYEWEENYPSRSGSVAGDRKFDVYMGIDVFGRGTYGGGQWNTNRALDVVRKGDVSAAIFAPGWVYETKQAPDFETAQNRWWSLVEKSWGIVRKYLRTLPFYTNFDQGRGFHISVDGDQISEATWCNISSQGIQPLLEFADSSTNPIQLLVDLKEASYSGGGNITFKGSLEKDTKFMRRIYEGEFILSESLIHFFYSVKSDSNSSLGIVLKFTSTVNKSMSVLLTSQGIMDDVSSAFTKVVTTNEHKGKAPGWVINEGAIEMKGYVLTEIHALCYRPKVPPREMGLKSRPLGPDHAAVASSTDYFAVLGHVTVKTSNYKPDFPVSSLWLVDGEFINWTSHPPQDSRILSVKISWKLKEGKKFVFQHYNVYVQKLPKVADGNQSTASEHVQEYLGVAHVNCFYVSELKVPPSVSSLKFIIQVFGFDGTNQNLAESPFYQLEVKGP